MEEFDGDSFGAPGGDHQTFIAVGPSIASTDGTELPSAKDYTIGDVGGGFDGTREWFHFLQRSCAVFAISSLLADLSVQLAAASICYFVGTTDRRVLSWWTASRGNKAG